MAPTAVTTPATAIERVLLHDVAWSTYEALLADLGDHGGMRLTYDRGTLEIMSPSNEHERAKRLLGRLVEALTESLGIPVRSGGSTTLRSELRARGLEPDECYWLANEAALRGKRELDLAVDPPPDLVIEVEVSRSAVDRLPIYAALRVPEVWCFAAGRVTTHRLDDSGEYARASRSAALPFLDPAVLGRWVERAYDTDETTWIRQFRAWVDAEFGRPKQGSAPKA